MNKPDFGKAKKEAQKIIEEKGFKEPPISPLDVAISYGLSVYTMDMPAEYSTVAGFLDLKEKKILVNSSDPLSRQTFTIAHELGHYILHKSLLEKYPDKYSILYRTQAILNEKSVLEKEVDCFAANLLVPIEILRKYKDLPISAIAALFQVSREVINIRLKDLRWYESIPS